MSLLRELTEIMEESRRLYQQVKSGKPVLREERAEFPSSADCCGDLYCGDNLSLMKYLLEEEDMAGKLQMIYIDPPFFTKSNYDAQVKAGDANLKHAAYEDRWKDMASYLQMLAVRLLLMRDLLSESGLIWLHLDWHVVHYAKVLMDDIFGEKQFVNEIIWQYKSGGSTKKHFSRKHDTILVYAKGKDYNFYPLQEKSYNRQMKPYHFKGVEEFCDDLGWYTKVNMKDVWSIDMVGRTSAERTGYATQKPEQLLERILKSCTKEGELCADFFCGSGTLPVVAAKLGRRFIACDMGEMAIEGTTIRLEEKNTSFRLFYFEAYKPKLQVHLRISENTKENSLCIEITGLEEKHPDTLVEKKSKEKLLEILEESPLSLLWSWSVGPCFDDDVHRPVKSFIRTNGNLEYSCQLPFDAEKQLSLKFVDVFGNTSYERIEIEHEGNVSSEGR